MRALIVDDSPTARAHARSTLEAAMATAGLDFDVMEAGGGVEAVRALTEHEVDLLIVDLHMPDMTGLEVLAYWHKRVGPKRRVALVVSTDVSPRDRDKALENGAHSVLEKPLAEDRLREALSSLSAVG